MSDQYTPDSDSTDYLYTNHVIIYFTFHNKTSLNTLTINKAKKLNVGKTPRSMEPSHTINQLKHFIKWKRSYLEYHRCRISQRCSLHHLFESDTMLVTFFLKIFQLVFSIPFSEQERAQTGGSSARACVSVAKARITMVKFSFGDSGILKLTN